MAGVDFVPLRALGKQAEEKMPSARSGSCAMTIGDDVIMFGGLCGDSELLNDVHVFSTKTCQWTAVEVNAAEGHSKPRPSFGACSIELNDGTCMILGGQCFQRFPSSTIHHLDIKQKLWYEAKAEPLRRGGEVPEDHPNVYRWGATLLKAPQAWWPRLIGRQAAASATDVVLELCGDGEVPHRDVTVLWRTAQQPFLWTFRLVNQGPEMLYGRRRHAAAVFKDEFIFLFGGRCERRFLQDLWVYSISANCWCELTLTTDPELLKELFAAAALNQKDPATVEEDLAIQRAVMHAINKQRDPHAHAGVDSRAWPGQRTGLVGYMSRDSFVIMTGFAVKSIDSYLTYNDVWSFDLRKAAWNCVVPQRNFTGADRAVVEAQEKSCVGPQPHSMSAVAPLPNAPPGTYLLHGGRLHDHAINEAFVIRILPPGALTLYDAVRRTWIHSEVRNELRTVLLRDKIFMSPRRGPEVPPRAVDEALRKAITSVSGVTPACRLFSESMSASAMMDASSMSFLTSMEAYPEG
jgi:hypothetical protein